ncbi:NUDIX domain-containing protein [Bacillus aerolatus]|uniref:NUDIX domain-containing protein n=1 Tax=Bacillus aerolatus TaxID=2653354 RepID=A0A6I1FFB7_9BACI|nr:8-oxo-dGTP diphosphatase [Bacillus aerolatus]KAB7704181.1 NUDIX domain-containing protein [Bacillus aerolatus]
MQRVTNCLLLKDDEVLLLQKPRRNWWVAPGGKMEPGESIRDAVIREYREETGIYLRRPAVKGIFTFIIKDGDDIISEWMMFTFFAKESDGVSIKECEEGQLEWHPVEKIKELPMAEGDRHILEYMVHGTGVIYGAFTYTPDFKLLSYRLDPN